MQSESSIQTIKRQPRKKIEHLFHLVQFKNIKQSKINKVQIRNIPDFQEQNHQLMVHMFYLIYLSYHDKINIYVYDQLCQDRWGIIFNAKFMKKINKQDDFLKDLLKSVDFAIAMEQKFHGVDEDNQSIPICKQQDFFTTLTQLQKKTHLQPKQIIRQLEQIQFVRNRLYILKVISSILLPLVMQTPNQRFIQNYIENVKEEQAAIRRIFQNHVKNQIAASQFQNRIRAFFCALNPSGNTSSTPSQKAEFHQKGKQNKVLVAQLTIQVKRNNRYDKEKHTEDFQDKSNKGSEPDYQKPSPKRVKIFIYMKINPSFQSVLLQVSLQFTSKKICELNYIEVEEIWQKICEKWKIMIDKNDSFSQFNPSFIDMAFSKDGIIIKDSIKEYPTGHLITYATAYIDRLIMIYLLLEDIVQYYHQKQNLVEFYSEGQKRKLELNDGQIQILAKSAYLGQRYYEYLLKDTMTKAKDQIQKSKSPSKY